MTIKIHRLHASHHSQAGMGLSRNAVLQEKPETEEVQDNEPNTFWKAQEASLEGTVQTFTGPCSQRALKIGRMLKSPATKT